MLGAVLGASHHAHAAINDALERARAARDARAQQCSTSQSAPPLGKLEP